MQYQSTSPEEAAAGEPEAAHDEVIEIRVLDRIETTGTKACNN